MNIVIPRAYIFTPKKNILNVLIPLFIIMEIIPQGTQQPYRTGIKPRFLMSGTLIFSDNS